MNNVIQMFQWSHKVPAHSYVKCHCLKPENMSMDNLEGLLEQAIHQYKSIVGKDAVMARLTVQKDFEGNELLTFEIEGMNGYDPEDRIIVHAY